MTIDDKPRRIQARAIWKFFRGDLKGKMDPEVMKWLEEELEKAERRGDRRTREAIFNRGREVKP